MVTFLRQVLALRVNFQEPTTTEFSTSEGVEIQVMAPGDAYYNFFTEHAAGPVPLFEVDDIHRARQELEEAGIEVIGATGRDSRWQWIHVRAPDGNLCETRTASAEMLSRRDHFLCIYPRSSNTGQVRAAASLIKSGPLTDDGFVADTGCGE